MAQKKRNGDYMAVIRTEMVKEREAFYEGTLADPKAAAAFAAQFFRNATREMVVVVSLDAKNSPIAAEVVAVGLLSSCMVGVPEVFRHAVTACAASILCFHNHPSSSLRPSKDDIQVTGRLREAGKLLGIPLLDHIIIGGEGGYLSLKEAGHFCGDA